MQVERIPATGLHLVAGLLEEFLRDGEPLPDDFLSGVGEAVERGDVVVFGALTGIADRRYIGVLTLYVRPSFALGGEFASVEDLYVQPEHRGTGTGTALISAAQTYCRKRGISYVEVQVEEKGAEGFYRAMGYEEEDVRVMSVSQLFGGDFGSSRTS